MVVQTKNVREKEMKRQTLLELVDYVNTGTGKFTEPVRCCSASLASLLRCWFILFAVPHQRFYSSAVNSGAVQLQSSSGVARNSPAVLDLLLYPLICSLGVAVLPAPCLCRGSSASADTNTKFDKGSAYAHRDRTYLI